MRLYSSILACSLLALGLLACSNDETKSGSGTPFGTGGSSASGGSGGSGGSGASAGSAGSGGEAGTSGGAGSGGSSGKDAGAEAGGDAAPDAVADTGGDVGQDAVPDIVIQIDTCPMAQASLGTQGMTAGGDTPTAFATAYNDELTTSTAGPFLMVFDGLDVDDPNAGSWIVQLGAAEDVGGGTMTFGETPVDASYRLGEDRAVAIDSFDGEFSLRFGAVDIPVVQVKMGGQFNPECDMMGIEDMTLLIPATASSVAFHGSTLGDLLGAPTASYGSGTDNAWAVSLSGVAAAVAYQ